MNRTTCLSGSERDSQIADMGGRVAAVFFWLMSCLAAAVSVVRYKGAAVRLKSASEGTTLSRSGGLATGRGAAAQEPLPKNFFEKVGEESHGDGASGRQIKTRCHGYVEARVIATLMLLAAFVCLGAAVALVKPAKSSQALRWDNPDVPGATEMRKAETGNRKEKP